MRKRLAPLLICSLACSIAAFAAPALGAMHVQGLTVFNLSLIVSMGFSIAWLLIFIVAFYLRGPRGLWLLLGLPAAIFWPAIYLWLVVAISLCEASQSTCFP
jgi:hypothetical protein